MGEAVDTVKKPRAFKVFTYRGVVLEDLMKLPMEKLKDMMGSRLRRRIKRGLDSRVEHLLMKVKKTMVGILPGQTPKVIKTHLRSAPIFPCMVGSIIAVYNGKEYIQVEIKPEMIGHTLGEFSLSYKPIKHGRPGIGATHSSRFIPLK